MTENEREKERGRDREITRNSYEIVNTICSALDCLTCIIRTSCSSTSSDID